MQTIKSGALRLTAISESTGAGFRPEFLFPDFDANVFSEAPMTGGPLFFHAEKGKLMSSIHSWLFKLNDKLVLVDTCMGRGKGKGLDGDPEGMPFFKSLAEAGVMPADIDLVVLTHLHTDHMMNNTIADEGGFRPTFENARYLVGAREFAHWQPGGAGLALYPEQAPILEECVSPLVAAGVLELIDDETEIMPGFTTFPVPGHTATQLALKIEHDGQQFVHGADSIHHPLQVYRPQWGSSLCEDGKTAHQTRLQLLDYCAANDAVLMASHFAGPRAGLIRRDGDGYGFEPIEIATAPLKVKPRQQAAAS